MSIEERKKQGKKALSILGTLLFGSEKAAAKQWNELGEGVEESVEEGRARRARRIGGPAIDTEGESTDE